MRSRNACHPGLREGQELVHSQLVAFCQRPAIVAEDSGVRLAGGPPGEALPEDDAQSVLPPPYRIY